MNNKISIKVNGGTLVAYVQNDGCADQAGIYYIPDGDTTEIDVCLAEVKGEELSGKKNNKDIDVYVFSSPCSEEWTKHYKIDNKDIMEALNEA